MTAVYPGTFDPVTNGHLDIIERAGQIFDLIIVAVSENPGKEPLFTREERIEMIKEATAHLPRVKVEPFDGLLCHFARSRGARVVVRGLRALSDFDYEFQMALMNKKLYPELETVFLVTNSAYSYLRSSVVKEVAYFGGCVDDLVPKSVDRKLRQKFGDAAKHRGGQVTEL